MVKKNACIFISGKGSNLKNLINRSRDYSFPISIKLVVSNKKEALGIQHAKRNFIPYLIIDTKSRNFDLVNISLIGWQPAKIFAEENKANFKTLEALNKFPTENQGNLSEEDMKNFRDTSNSAVAQKIADLVNSLFGLSHVNVTATNAAGFVHPIVLSKILE